MNRYLVEFYAMRRRLQLGIAAASIVAGALLGVALTALRLERRFPEKQKTLPSDLQPPAP